MQWCTEKWLKPGTLMGTLWLSSACSLVEVMVAVLSKAVIQLQLSELPLLYSLCSLASALLPSAVPPGWADGSPVHTLTRCCPLPSSIGDKLRHSPGQLHVDVWAVWVITFLLKAAFDHLKPWLVLSTLPGDGWISAFWARPSWPVMPFLLVPVHHTPWRHLNLLGVLLAMPPCLVGCQGLPGPDGSDWAELRNPPFSS